MYTYFSILTYLIKTSKKSSLYHSRTIRNLIMNYESLLPIIGIIRNISQTPGNCCSQMISLSTVDGPVNFIISANTFIIDNTRLRPGMAIAAFYDTNRPIPLIFPPQYQAELITTLRGDEIATINFFNRNLTAADNSLRLNRSRSTNISTMNGQSFNCSPGENFLLVYYSTTTRSIPPQTTPRRIVVLCR